MEVYFALILTVGFIMHVMVVPGQTYQDDTLEKRLSNLEYKFERFGALLEGFEELCSKLKEKKPDLPEVSSEVYVESELSNSEEENGGQIEQMMIAKVRLVSVESKGLSENTIDVSLIFFAEDEYSVRWQVRHRNSTFTRIKGEETEKIVKSTPRRVVVATATLHDADIIEWVLITVRSDNDYIQLSLNITSIQETGVQAIDQIDYKVMRYNPTITVPSNILKSEGIESTVEVTENVVEAMNADSFREYIYFSYVNTTASPAKFVEILDIRDQNKNISVKVKNGSDNELVMTVGKQYAQYGGLLSLVLPQNASGYLRDFSYGISIKIINEDIQDIMPAGTVAIHELEEKMYYRGPYFTIACLGIGIPLPDVKIFKLKRDGTLNELKADEEIVDGLFHTKSLNFNPRKPLKPDGEYVCRVSNENQLAEASITVQKYGDIAFDEHKSGVTKDTSEKTSVTCKASGNPMPELELRKGDEYGENLLMVKSERYKHKLVVRKNVSKVMLTISPPDPTIQTITCVAKQTIGKHDHIDKTFTIKIKE